ncbi:hypothetical protein [Gramella sp. AN32]|uniref:Uncharacterized protein n=1 Tax=Christiangramia antarctica TaxID=2058158 RepID=A0ABW5X4K8_9FLAO
MILGKAFAIRNSCGLWVILVNATYSAALKTRIPIIIPKLKEKITVSNDANMETIIKANREMGKPKMTALFLMFL